MVIESHLHLYRLVNVILNATWFGYNTSKVKELNV